MQTKCFVASLYCNRLCQDAAPSFPTRDAVVWRVRLALVTTQLHKMHTKQNNDNNHCNAVLAKRRQVCATQVNSLQTGLF